MVQSAVAYACITVCLLVVGVISDESGGPKEPDFVPTLAFIRTTVPSVPKIDTTRATPPLPPPPPPVIFFTPPPPPPPRPSDCPRNGEPRHPHPVPSIVDVGPTREKRQAVDFIEARRIEALPSSKRAAEMTRRDRSQSVKRNFTKLLDSATARDVDLCFLVDVTGSMTPHINGVRDAIFDIVESLTNTTDDLAVTDLRMAFVGYRDFSDGERKHFTVLDFTRDVETFHRFVSGTPATGGGDGPEDVHGGLDRALTLEWGRPGRTRLVFHMADAPGHGCDLHHFSSDGFPSGDPKDRTFKDLFGKLNRMEIDYAFGNITSDTAIMVEAFAKARNDAVKTFDLSYAYAGTGGGGAGSAGPSDGMEGHGRPGPHPMLGSIHPGPHPAGPHPAGPYPAGFYPAGPYTGKTFDLVLCTLRVWSCLVLLWVLPVLQGQAHGVSGPKLSNRSKLPSGNLWLGN